MKYKSVSRTVDLNILLLYFTLLNIIENNTYPKDINDKVLKLLNYLYYIIYPHEKKNNADLISLKYKYIATYKD